MTRIVDYVCSALAQLERGTVYEIHALLRQYGIAKSQISCATWKLSRQGIVKCEGRRGPNPAKFWLVEPTRWTPLNELPPGDVVEDEDVDEPLPRREIGPQEAWPSVFHYGSGASVTLTWNAAQAAERTA